jgi:hypothetical protein
MMIFFGWTTRLNATSKSLGSWEASAAFAASRKRSYRSASVSFGFGRLESPLMSLPAIRFMFRMPRAIDVGFPSTRLAYKNVTSARKFSYLLQDAFFPPLVTVWTYGMWRLQRLGTFLQGVNEHVLVPNWLKLITFFLSVPCFKASDFCFKCAYLLNQRRLRRIGLYCASLGGQDLSIEFADLGRALFIRSKRCPIFDNIGHLLKRAEHATKVCQSFCQSHSPISPNSDGLDS